jgi:hypothetical protein
MLQTKELYDADVAVSDIDEEPLSNEPITEEAPAESRSLQSIEEFGPLFDSRVAEQLRTQWLEIQSGFVDDPNISLKYADELVIGMIENIITTLSEKRMTIEDQWQSDDRVSTEDLRLTLKNYRSFFNRLLALEYEQKL